MNATIYQEQISAWPHVRWLDKSYVSSSNNPTRRKRESASFVPEMTLNSEMCNRPEVTELMSSKMDTTPGPSDSKPRVPHSVAVSSGSAVRAGLWTEVRNCFPLKVVVVVGVLGGGGWGSEAEDGGRGRVGVKS